MTNELTCYDPYGYCVDATDCAEVLQKSVYGKCEPDITKQIAEAIYQLDAIAQNEYNCDYYRVFYNVLMQLAENYRDSHSGLTAYNIQWDTDGEDVGLPDTMEIPPEITDTAEISDYLFAMTGYCNLGFELR